MFGLSNVRASRSIAMGFHGGVLIIPGIGKSVME